MSHPQETDGVAPPAQPQDAASERGWHYWRKRLAPLAMLIAVVTLVSRDCSERPVDISVTVVLIEGASRLEGVSAVSVELMADKDDEAEGWFRGEYPDGWAPAKLVFSSKLLRGDVRVVVTASWKDGHRTVVERKATVSDGASIRVDVAKALANDPGRRSDN